MSRRLIWTLVGLAGAAGVGLITWLVVDSSSSSSHVEHAFVNITDSAKEPLTSKSTYVPLTVGGVQSCSPEKKPDTLEALHVRQIHAEVDLIGLLRIYEGEFNCETTSANIQTGVVLDKPLGSRLIIDQSRGQRRVISSPAIRAELLRSSHRTTREAQTFAKSRFQVEDGVACVHGGVRGFVCGLSDHAVNVFVGPDGRFAAAPLGTSAGAGK